MAGGRAFRLCWACTYVCSREEGGAEGGWVLKAVAGWGANEAA